MAKIKIERQVTGKQSDVSEALNKYVADSGMLDKFNGNIKWVRGDYNHGIISSKHVNGGVTVASNRWLNKHSQLEIELKLGFFASFYKKKLTKELNRHLDLFEASL